MSEEIIIKAKLNTYKEIKNIINNELINKEMIIDMLQNRVDKYLTDDYVEKILEITISKYVQSSLTRIFKTNYCLDSQIDKHINKIAIERLKDIISEKIDETIK